MSQRKNDQDRFAHSPFKLVKGLPVSGEARKPSAVPPPPPPPPREDETEDLFAREMEWLAVRPLPGDPAATAAPDAGRSKSIPVADAGMNEFMAAVGPLDKTFKDELPELEAAPRPRPRRMKQLERGELKPAGELDLHGLTKEAAVARTRTYLEHAARQGWPVVLVVTGKGLHSSEGPVLRQAVERLLDDAGGLVVEWGEAPRRFGGAGALAVFLRGQGRG